MKRPLLWISAFFCAGIMAAAQSRIDFWLIYFVAMAGILFCLFFRHSRFWFFMFLFCFIFSLAFSLTLSRKILPAEHIGRIHLSKEREVILKGFLDSSPQIKDGNSEFVLEAREYIQGDQKRLCQGKVLARVSGKADFEYAGEVVLQGFMRKVQGNSRVKTYRIDNYLAKQGIYAVIDVPSPALAIAVGRTRRRPAIRGIFWLKSRMEAMIHKHCRMPAAGIVDAMVFGEKSQIPAMVNYSMMKSGTIHILVVSGFNTGLVVFILALFLKMLRFPRILRFYIILPALLAYCLMTGASTPVMRATVMAIFFMLGNLLDRETDIYNACCLSALFILVIDPNQLFDIGFQLSFISVLAIVFFYPRLKLIFRLEGLKLKPLKWLVDGCLVSLSAWLGTAGLIAGYFKIFSPVTVLANLLIVPLATLITFCGFSLVFAGLASPLVAGWFGRSCELLVSLLLHCNYLVIKLPGAYWYLS